MTKMTEDELLKLIEEEERTSLSYLAGQLSDERAENMELYLGDKTRELSAVEGRSSVVSMDVQEAIESVMPSLMKVFASGDEIVKFEPVGPEDVKPSEQETDYVNHVCLNQNNGYLVMYQWFKDALLNKNAYVKFWWDESTDVTQETYNGLTDPELQMLLQGDEVEPVEHESYPDEQALAQIQPQLEQLMPAAQAGDPQAMAVLQQAQAQVPMLHNVKVKRTNTHGQVKIEPCPPEEILVSADERSIDPNSTRFFEHRSWKTISDLREMGYDVDDDIPDDATSLWMSEEWLARQEFTEDEIFRGDNDLGANRRVVYREVYYKVDFDGDGIAERRMVCLVGKNVLSNETADIVPFAAITPYLMPHRHIGRALADLVKDIQIIKSVIMRNILDNFYASNNGRWAISDKVNLDDMLVSRPGGVVRVEGSPGSEIMPMAANPLGNAAFPLMEYLDTIKETRTGVTKYNQGLDANSLNKTASGISQIMGAAQMRLELIARTFAETGVKQLFLGVHKLLLQNSKKQQITRLKNEWVPVDPRQWKTRTDMTVSVGLGTGNKQEMLVQIMQILTVQERALPLGIATPQNIYEACVELTKNAGFKDGEKYWTNPAQQQQQQPKPDPKMIEVQEKLKLEQQKMQMEGQKDQAEFQQSQQQQQMDYQLAQQKLQNELDIARDKMVAEIEIHREKVMAEIQLERERMGLQAQQHSELMRREPVQGGV
jgi:hypothetical protein